MLYCKDANFSLFSNTISNCYIPNFPTGKDKAVIYDYSSQMYANFQSNTITFSDTEHSCRAYYFFANTNIIWKYDTITNAKVPETEQGSCGHFWARYGSNQPLEFNGCTFSNCYGGTYSVIYIDNLNDNYVNPNRYLPLNITNTTFKNIKNNKNYPANSNPAYLIYGKYQNQASSGEVYIYNCTFKFIESDMVMGCTFGSSKNFQITYDDTIFDGIYFSGERNGGVLIFDEVNDKKITVKNCLFKNILSKNGGCAIYYSAKTKDLTVENTDFSDSGSSGFVIESSIKQLTIHNASISFPENDNNVQCGGILINSIGVFEISSCKFDQIKGEKSIYYKPNDYGFNNINSFTIDDCTFDHCDGECIYIEVVIDSLEVVTIRQCNFIYVKNKNGGLTSNTIGFNQYSKTLNLYFDSNYFLNCGKDGYIITFDFDYADELTKSVIEFNNNVFKFDGTDGGCVALQIFSKERPVLINNCTFQSCTRNSGYMPYENTLSANYLPNIIIEKCQFIDGGRGNNGNVIALQSEIQEATVQNCSFYCQNNNICGAAISIYTNFISIIGNSFERCGQNTIRYQGQENKDNRFVLIENHFEHLSDGTIIEAASTMKISPIIEGNIFENIDIHSNSLNLKVQESSNTILLENNTFRNFKTSNGGFGGSFYHKSASSFHLTFNNCYFLDNHQDTNGGGFKGHSNMKTDNVYYKFYKCFFDNNEASNLGGAILIENCIDCTIESCEFTSNSLKDNNGKGGAISFSSGNKAIISGCKFSNNHCFVSNAIYTKEDCAHLLINENTEFYSNYNPNINDQQFMILAECMQIDFADVKFNCENDNHPNQGCIHFTRLSTISFTRVQFQYLSSNSIILYQPNLDEADTEFIVDECKFEHCRGKSLSFTVKEKSIEKITISKTIFQDCKDNTNGHTTNTIYINQVGSLITLKVNDNQFINCGTQGYIIFLELNEAQNSEAIEFNNNEFKFDGTDGGCVALRILQPGRELYINNCTFYLCVKISQPPWENTLSANHLSIIHIENSKFINCGHEDDGGNIISIQGGVGRCEIYYSSFVSNDEKPCGAGLCSYCSNTKLVGNTFENCVKNTVRFESVVLNEFIFNYNHFIRCHIGSLIYFNWESKLTQNPTFEGNTFENIQLTSNGNEEVIFAFLIRVQDSSKSILFENNTFKDFQTLQGGVGAYFQYNANSPLYLTFNNCNFIDNHQNTEGGGFSSSNNYNSKNVYLTFRGCFFQNNQASDYGGALTIDTRQESSIEDCEFTSNSINSDTGKGGAISVRNDKSVSIKRCTFHNNNAASGGGALYFYQTSNEILDFIVSDCTFGSNKDASNLGHAIYFEQITSDETKLIINENCLFTDNGDFDNRNHQGYTITSFAPILNFVNSRIEFTNVNKATAGIILDGSGSSFVNNVSFYHTNSYNEQDYNSMGIMICTSTNRVEINNCTFDCCGTNKNKKAIQNKGTNTIINDCQFLNEPGDSYVKTSAINIVNYGIHIITNCFAQFTSTNSGAFSYNPTSATDMSQQSFTFENITIDDSQGDDRKSLSLELGNANMLYLKNVTFSNTYKQYNCIVGIIVPNRISQIELIKFNFINCTVADDNIGGIGLWIQVSNTHLLFINSLFEGNKAIHTDQKGNLGLGGALVIGRHWQTSDLRMTIEGCNFTNNHANSNGGAILISAQHTILIENCTFIGNSGENAGAIYADINNQVSEECKISNCTFDDNKATSGQGSSLYLISASTRLCEITDCQFINNQEEKDIIYSKSGQLKIHDISFVLNNFNEKIRPVYLYSSSNSVEIYNTNFVNCFFDGNGNAIKAEQENNNLNVHNCQFEDCGNKGHSILSLASGSSFENNIFSCKNSECNFGSISILSDQQISVVNCSFIKTSNSDSILLDTDESEQFSFENINPDGIPALHIQQSSSNSVLVIVKNCTFDGCSIGIHSCFKLSLFTSQFAFNENVMKNMNGNDYNSYFGLINLNSLIDTLEIRNMHFIDNIGRSLFGGGIGLLFYGINKLSFYDCYFINNKAEQDQSHSRPKPSNDKPYYNGDGGGIQLGYICPMNDIDVVFERCHFTGNEAYRHGGAIAIQTLKTVEILHCEFDSNTANHISSSANLLATNHFHLKNEGRGGAIYINPTYETESSLCSSTNLYMSNVHINNCTFKSNKAYDGYAIYIEGENLGTTFTIDKNNFIDNFYKETLERNSSIIATEICIESLSYETIIDQLNTFSNQEDGVSIYCNIVSCVDFRGNIIPTKKFSESDKFSNSEFFSKSDYFSDSKQFSRSVAFSESSDFSFSSEFSKSFDFTVSNKFSESIDFSKSKDFSNSNKFSESVLFSESEFFSKTNDFSFSSFFSQSNKFSESEAFSKSNDFTNSEVFSKSNDFSVSSYFSESSLFSKSSDFTVSSKFSESSAFSKSNEFTNSEGFSKTTDFSVSSYFSESSLFSQSSDFTFSGKFSESSAFSKSQEFSESDKFTKSDYFSESTDFTISGKFTESGAFSTSDYFSNSYKFTKSAQFSESNDFTFSSFFSKSDLFSKSSDFSYSTEFTKSVDFSESNKFTESALFSESGAFSKTGGFSESSDFSYSTEFTKSTDFSNSVAFSFSNDFSESNKFTKSALFSESGAFSKTGGFSESSDFSYSTEFTKSTDFTSSVAFSFSNDFSESNKFTESALFSESGAFSETGGFSKSSDFSYSTEFTKSTDFSNSVAFSFSNDFSESNKFTKSALFSNSNDFTVSDKFSFSGMFTKSEAFSISSMFSLSNDFTHSNPFSFSKAFSESEDFSISEKFTTSNMFSASAEFSESNGFSSSFYFSKSTVFSFSSAFSNSDLFSFSGKFTASNIYSESEFFSKSADFSKSDDFSNSIYFSKSEDFTKSQLFSVSSDFSKSSQFSLSNAFSKSAMFSASNMFSLSTEFTKSDLFSTSEEFSKSSHFSKSNAFSVSDKFTISNAFSKSAMFSTSNMFSLSTEFTKSDLFSTSNKFSKSNAFSVSDKFTVSDAFSKSTMFSTSNMFSLSTEFTKSDLFSTSEEFSKSSQFSISIAFSKSEGFTYSQFFSKTSYFSLSNDFTISNVFSQSQNFSHSSGFLPSKIFTKSKIFSQSSDFAQTHAFSYTKEFSYSNKFTQSSYFSHSELFLIPTINAKSEKFSRTGMYSTDSSIQINDFSFSTEFTQSKSFKPSEKFIVNSVDKASNAKKKKKVIIGVAAGVASVVAVAVAATVFVLIHKRFGTGEKTGAAGRSMEANTTGYMTAEEIFAMRENSNPLYDDDIHESRDPFLNDFDEF